MTDTTKLLALARAVYPDAQKIWRDESELKLYVHEDCGAITQFDPANNSDQFVAVLAWIIVTCKGYFDCGRPDHVALFNTDRDDWDLFPHDGTAAGLRAAVTEAAMRVAG